MKEERLPATTTYEGPRGKWWATVWPERDDEGRETGFWKLAWRQDRVVYWFPSYELADRTALAYRNSQYPKVK